MTGRTGYTGVTNDDPPYGPEQITDVYEHFDPLIGETAATASALPASGNWTGRTVYVQDTAAHYVWNGSAWKRLDAATTTAFSFTSFWSAGTPTPQVVTQGSRRFVEGIISSSSVAYAAGTEYTVGSIPSGATGVAPSSERIFPCMANGTAVFGVKFKTNGTVTITPNTSFSGALGLSLNGSWRI